VVSIKKYTYSLVYIVDNIQNTCEIRMIWAGYLARMERGDMPAGVSWGNLRQWDHSEDLGVDENLIL